MLYAKEVKKKKRCNSQPIASSYFMKIAPRFGIKLLYMLLPQILLHQVMRILQQVLLAFLKM